MNKSLNTDTDNITKNNTIGTTDDTRLNTTKDPIAMLAAPALTPTATTITTPALNSPRTPITMLA